MKLHLRENWLFGLILLILSVFYYWGLPRVPFHPDESTYLYMSADFEALWRQPGTLAWDPAREADPRQRYRELDAPLTRYLIGFGCSLAGLAPLPADWDWAQTWQANQAAGALPDDRLLLVSRLSVAGLFPLTLGLTYLTGGRLGGPSMGALAVLFLGTNSLVMLHTRRAMAEGALVFAIALFLWALTAGKQRPWLLGLSVALAFNAKHSAIALVPIGLMAVVWSLPRPALLVRRLIPDLFQFLGVMALTTLALNPLFWSDPAGAAEAAWRARQDLLQRQAADHLPLAVEGSLPTPGERALALLANLYVLPPSFAEVGNYLENTETGQAAYLATPGHSLFRGLVGGGLLLALTLIGALLAAWRIWRSGAGSQRALALLSLASLTEMGTLVISVPLPWQRYVLPLVPFVGLWSAFALGDLMAKLTRIVQRSQNRVAKTHRV